MSRVRSENTTPELAVRRLVFGMGYRYRLHDKRLPGKPDLVFAGRRKAIFVHGCFWHGHVACRYGKLPKSRIEFWSAKIARNKERDLNNEQRLIDAGWRVLIVWQCELKDLERLKQTLYEFLET
jgi:DNA mismatch endonuclease (patch repair protein)